MQIYSIGIPHVSAGYLQLENRMNQLKMNENLNSIDFRRLAPDKDCMPVELFRKCANQIMLDQGSTVFQYGDPAGYLPLRGQYCKTNAISFCICANRRGFC